MAAQSAHLDASFRHQVRRLHRLGPRPIAEILAEIMGRYPHARPLVEERVERYAAMDPDLVGWVGGADWVDSVDVVRLVGGRP